MRWYLKSAGFKVLSALPGGSKFYAFTQERITRSTQATRPRVEQKISVGLQYWQWLKAHDRADVLRQGALLDFGAGWHPTIPLLFYSLGADHQSLVDVSPLLDVPAVQETARIFCNVTTDPDWSNHGELRRWPEVKANGTSPVTEVLRGLGMEYVAPCGAFFEASPGRFDLIFCTQVLRHLDRDAQRAIFRDLFSCLKPGGLFLATEHLVGHFGNPHESQRRYQHLVPSPWFWERVVNSSLMSYNRLKAPDYREALEQTGFRLRDFSVEGPSAEDLEALRRTRTHPAFARYSEHDLGARHLFFVAEKP